MSATGSGIGGGLKMDLQALIDAAAEGGVVVIPPDEYTGPFLLRKAITLRGERGATLTCAKGPVLVVDSPGVVLEHLILEVGSSNLDGHDGCALEVKSGHIPRTLDVRVRGSVIGVAVVDILYSCSPS